MNHTMIEGLNKAVSELTNHMQALLIVSTGNEDEFTAKEKITALTTVLTDCTEIAVSLLAPVVATILVDKGNVPAALFLQGVSLDVLSRASSTLEDFADEIEKEKNNERPAQANADRAASTN